LKNWTLEDFKIPESYVLAEFGSGLQSPHAAWLYGLLTPQATVAVHESLTAPSILDFATPPSYLHVDFLKCYSPRRIVFIPIPMPGLGGAGIGRIFCSM
jgi:hypothetical protein